MSSAPGDLERLATLAVLAASAKEAQELLEEESHALPPAVLKEADRRRKTFLHAMNSWG